MLNLDAIVKRVWYIPYTRMVRTIRVYGHTVRVWYAKLYHTRIVHTIRVWYRTLTSECKCKSAPAQYTNIVITDLAPLQSLSRKQIKTISTLCKPLLSLMSELKVFLKLY